MKKAFIWTLVAVVAVLLFVFLRPASVETTPHLSGASVLALEPLRSTVAPGDTVLVNLVARDVRDLFGVQLSVSYDPEVLAFIQATEETFLSRSGADDTMYLSVLDTRTPGLVKDFVLVKLSDEGTSGSGVVGTFTFQARAAGTSDIRISEIIAADKTATPLPVGTVGTTVTVR